SSILIESGGYPNDSQKQYLRELNFVTMIKALESILTGSYSSQTVDAYHAIPENERRMLSLIIKDLQVPVGRQKVRLDVGYLFGEIWRGEQIYYPATIVDVGDLGTHSGFQEFSASRLEVLAGQWYPTSFRDLHAFSQVDWPGLIRKGYLGFYIRSAREARNPGTTFLIYKNTESEDDRLTLDISPGKNPTFILRAPVTGQQWVVHNGQVYEMENFIDKVRKALVSGM